MSKPRGGQSKHWAEKARVQSWYSEVKRRCNWSDYMLDNEFAWTEEGQASRVPDDPRPRTFEWIRKASRKPRGLDARWRNMDDLVVAVEQNQLFKGTVALYNADLWNLLQDTAPEIDVVENRIDRLLKANGLIRVPPERVAANELLLNEYGRISFFDRCLVLSLSRMDRLSQIALIWLLFLQTEPPHNSAFRAIVESIADKLLDEFFADYMPARHLDYYASAVGVLLQSRLDLSKRRAVGYGFVETLGTWPIIPMKLLGKLTEDDFISYVQTIDQWVAQKN